MLPSSKRIAKISQKTESSSLIFDFLIFLIIKSSVQKDTSNKTILNMAVIDARLLICGNIGLAK